MQAYNLNSLFKQLFEQQALPEDIQLLVNKAEQAVQKYLYGDKIEDDDPEESTASKAKSALNEIYWRALVRIVTLRVERCQGEDLNFFDEEKPFIDLGFFDERLCKNAQNPIEKIYKAKVPGSEEIGFGVLFFHEYLQKKYVEFMQFERRRRLEQEHREIIERIQGLPDHLKDLEKKRESLISACLRAKEISAVVRRIDELVLPEYILENKQGGLTSDERRSLAQIKMEKERMQYQRNVYLADLTKAGVSEAIENVDKQATEVRISAIKLKEELDHKNQQIKEDREEREGELMLKRVEVMSGEVLKVKNFAKMCARRGGTNFFSPLLSFKGVFTKPRILKEIYKAQEFDPKVFKNQRAYEKGTPDFLIMPGAGNGLFDWDNNTMALPILPGRSFEESLAMALISYRLDVDDMKKMENGLLELKAYKAYKPGPQLRQRVARDYVLWMTREAKGSLALDKEVRKWFVSNIAPSPEDFMIPLELKLEFERGRGREDMLEYYEHNVDKNIDVEKSLVFLGAINCLKEDYVSAIEKLKAAIEINPESPEAHYNLALAYEKRNSPKKSMNHWEEYMKVAESSWWVTMAKMHFQKLRNPI